MQAPACARLFCAKNFCTSSVAHVQHLYVMHLMLACLLCSNFSIRSHGVLLCLHRCCVIVCVHACDSSLFLSLIAKYSTSLTLLALCKVSLLPGPYACSAQPACLFHWQANVIVKTRASFRHPLNFRNQIQRYEAEQALLAKRKREEQSKAEFEAEQQYLDTLAHLPSQEADKYRHMQGAVLSLSWLPAVSTRHWWSPYHHFFGSCALSCLKDV